MERLSVPERRPSRRATARRPPSRCSPVEDVTLRFGGVTALDGVSFEVRPGELFAVIGPNGAGKTSIFNCINGVYRPQKGSIRLDGEDLIGRSPPAMARLGVARTFQNLGLFTHLTVIDNLMLGRHHLMRTGFCPAPSGGAAPSARRSSTARRSRRWSSCSRWRPTATRRPGCCPTACRSGSSSAARSRWSRGCCCSTSRWRA